MQHDSAAAGAAAVAEEEEAEVRRPCPAIVAAHLMTTVPRIVVPHTIVSAIEIVSRIPAMAVALVVDFLCATHALMTIWMSIDRRGRDTSAAGVAVAAEVAVPLAEAVLIPIVSAASLRCSIPSTCFDSPTAALPMHHRRP
jgi:hypothetical protein